MLPLDDNLLVILHLFELKFISLLLFDRQVQCSQFWIVELAQRLIPWFDHAGVLKGHFLGIIIFGSYQKFSRKSCIRVQEFVVEQLTINDH